MSFRKFFGSFGSNSEEVVEDNSVIDLTDTTGNESSVGIPSPTHTGSRSGARGRDSASRKFKTRDSSLNLSKSLLPNPRNPFKPAPGNPLPPLPPLPPLNLSEESTVEEEMAIIGNLEPYVANASIAEYLERFEIFVSLNAIDDVKEKTQWLCGYGGSHLYSKIKAVCSPAEPITVNYTILKPKLKALLCPTSVEIVERSRFHTREQKPGESVSQFVLALRSLAEHCNFGTELDKALRDRFMMGLADVNVRAAILKSGQTTFDQVVKEAQAHEVAESSKSLKKTTENEVNKVAQKKSYGYSNGNKRNNKNDWSCGRCGKKHNRRHCPAWRHKCEKCSIKGHFKTMCKTKSEREAGSSKGGKAKDLKSITAAAADIEALRLGKIGTNCLNSFTDTRPPELIKIKINHVSFDAEVDTGACVSVLSSIDYLKHFNNLKLEKCDDKTFTAANGTSCKTMGRIKVILNDQIETQALILKTEKPFVPLVGRTWLDLLKPNWRVFFNSPVESQNNKILQLNQNMLILVNAIKKDFRDVFEPSPHPIKKFKVSFNLKQDARPRYLKAVPVAFSLREKVTKMLNEMEQNGIIEKINNSKWASQVVLVPKKNGEIRICCNYKNTLNPALEDVVYPLPVIDEILSCLAHYSWFVKLDLTGAYLQLAVDEESQHLTAINTLNGLYKFLRLPFGIKTAPSHFQSVIDQILQGLEGVVAYFDDILIAGKTPKECAERLRLVLTRLREFNVQVNYDKCNFFERKLEYLGHVISEDGVAPCVSKVEALLHAPPPKDVATLRSFIGLLTYYSKFIPNLQSLITPLHDLTRKDVTFYWNKDCETIFKKCKDLIKNSPILAHYDPKLPLTIVCDASPYGVGAILNVIDNNGVERPVFMVSSTLSQAEKNYSQMHREALAIVFAVKKFHKYIYGYHCTIFTDCKVLETLLGGAKDFGSTMNSRFLRWLIFLQNYDITVKYRPSKATANADALSRLPMPSSTGVEEVSIKTINPICTFNDQSSHTKTLKAIAEATQNHAGCKLLYKYVYEGWPAKENIPEPLRYCYKIKDSLDIEDGCIFYGNRVFIPPILRKSFLELIHREHVGSTRCKQIARSTFWWPKVDNDIDLHIKQCVTCQTVAKRKSDIPLMSWKKTTRPLERVHGDHFFYEGKSFFVLVDDYSFWIQCFPVKSTDTEGVIESIKEFCSTHGLFQSLVTDNATAFTAKYFKVFCDVNHITHMTSPAHHPQSNGLAERAVGIVKDNLKKFRVENRTGSLTKQLVNFHFSQHTTPLSSCNKSPADLIFNRKITTHLSQLQNGRVRQQLLSDESECEYKRQDKTEPSALKEGQSKSPQRSREPQWKKKPKINLKRKIINYKDREGKEELEETKDRLKNKNIEIGSEIYFYSSLEKKWVRAIVLKKESELKFRIKIHETGQETSAHLDCMKLFYKNVEEKIDKNMHDELDLSSEKKELETNIKNRLRKTDKKNYKE